MAHPKTRGKRIEDRGQKTEVRDQRTDVRGQKGKKKMNIEHPPASQARALRAGRTFNIAPVK